MAVRQAIHINVPGCEERQPALRIFARGDALLAFIEGKDGNPAGFVFAPWPWPSVERSKAPVFGGAGFTPAAVEVVECALSMPAERAEHIAFQQAFRWTFATDIDVFGGEVFGHAFSRGLLRDALAALIGAGGRQDRDITIELITLSVGPAIRVRQWLAAAVLLALAPGAPTEGEPMPLEAS